MPHLLNFIRNNGTLMTNDHTVLISHTATGILTHADGCLPRPYGPARLEQLPLLQAGRHDAHRRLVRVLDRTALRPGSRVPAGGDRHDAENDQRERQDRAGAVGSLYARGLRRRLGRRRPTPSSRTPPSTSRRCSAPARPRRPAVGDGPALPRTRRSPTSSASASTARQDSAVCAANRTPATRPASRRARRLQRLQGSVRREVRQPGDQARTVR